MIAGKRRKKNEKPLHFIHSHSCTPARCTQGTPARHTHAPTLSLSLSLSSAGV